MIAAKGLLALTQNTIQKEGKTSDTEANKGGKVLIGTEEDKRKQAGWSVLFALYTSEK